MRHNAFNQTSVRAILVLLIISLLIPLTAFSPSPVAYAAGGDAVNFDSTDVMDDLEGSSPNGVPFDLEDYPYDENGSPSVIGFYEYAYSEYENLLGNYGLYIYIYNPALLDIATGSGSNKIQIASEFDKDGSPADYIKMNLVSVDISDGAVANRFLKFKIVDASALLDIVDPDERNYYVSGVELATYGSDKSFEINVGMKFTFTGYAKGYGVGDESTLQSSFSKTKTIPLSVKHTNYKAGFSGNQLIGYQTDVNSVYFSIDDEILDEYGALVGIKSTWHQYLTPNTLVISDWDLYNDIIRFSGVEVSDYSYDLAVKLGFTALRNELMLQGFEDVPFITNQRFWVYLTISAIQGENGNHVLAPLVFYSDTNVSSTDLNNAIKEYDKSYLNGSVTVNGKTYSGDVLLSNQMPNAILGKVDFECGEIVKEVSIDDLGSVDLIHLDVNDNLLIRAFYGTDQGEPIKDILPIEELSAEKFNDSDAADKLLIDRSQISQVQQDVKEADANGQTTFIYRFAYSPYLTGEFPSIIGNDPGGYSATQAVFLDFDIIHLTFEKEGEQTIIPVVSNPTDIINDIEEPPVSSFDKWEDLADGFREFGESIKGFFNDVGNWFEENWDSIKIALIVISAVIGVVLLVWIISKIIGVFTGGKKTTIRIDVPKETETVQNARKKKPAKTINKKPRK